MTPTLNTRVLYAGYVILCEYLVVRGLFYKPRLGLQKGLTKRAALYNVTKRKLLKASL